MPWLRKTAPRIDFEFGARRGRSQGAGWVLLLAGLLFSVDVGRSYLALREKQGVLSARLAAVPPQPRSAANRQYEPKDLDREVLVARTTLQRLSLPWNALFKALGESETEGVMLLSVEPDADAGQVQMTAVARDIPSMLTYLSRIERNQQLTRAAITHHEIRMAEQPLPVYFVISAVWKRI